MKWLQFRWADTVQNMQDKFPSMILMKPSSLAKQTKVVLSPSLSTVWWYTNTVEHWKTHCLFHHPVWCSLNPQWTGWEVLKLWHWECFVHQAKRNKWHGNFCGYFEGPTRVRTERESGLHVLDLISVPTSSQESHNNFWPMMDRSCTSHEREGECPRQAHTGVAEELTDKTPESIVPTTQTTMDRCDHKLRR